MAYVGCQGVVISLARFFRPRNTRSCVVIHDQARASLARKKGPHPLDENACSKVGRGEKLDMDPGPGKPRKKSAEVEFATLQHGKALANDGHISFVEVAERMRR